MEHCSVELTSALTKVIVEQLIRLKAVNAVEEIPFSISRLLYLANNKSDLNIERDIFEQFCHESNKVLVDEIGHF